ncbi:glycine--tRNA ligase subunit beta [Telmatospirillum sp. J64-1]|uniref:glycine--tRNA ligase subunit beta n=1 Tax=Telmatospirillum sp. J64-1 TaxID=2502183 RepID=UPI00115C639E|nr:glycine--tRNA ligase subunit beta [Telmatospirillum sp. J64-1]
MAELLLELFSEEIPARMQQRAGEDLQRLVTDGLAKAGLEAGSSKFFVTPRRLTLVIDGLPEATPDVSEERRGPRVGAPEAAVEGFLRGAGVTLAECETRDTGKGEFLFAVIRRPGRATAEVLKEVVETALAEFPWPKSMRWGTNSVRYVRPLQSILCLFGGTVVPVSFGPITAGDTTRGHRFLSPEPFAVKDFADYAARLRGAHVMLDQNERRAAIEAEAAKLAAAEGLTVKPDEGLLAEVTGLVEWPVVLMGSIDEAFMDVPAEVLITSMRSHQKYFSTLTAEGKLAPRFVVVSNMSTADGGKAVVAGNQRVLRARLSDAKFFWDTDRKRKLESRLPKLSERIFHAKLGTLADKVQRMQALAKHLAADTIGADVADAMRAALLAKADLSTEMVGEFPELQGIMGRYYAREDGEKIEIAQAIAEHYSPLGPNDSCPNASLSVIAALADKVDTLVGFFGIDEKPTGSKDPYALRRAALGVIRLITENGLRLPLRPFFTFAHAQYAGTDFVHNGEATARDLLDFFADRLKVHFREQGVRHDLVNAVFALGDEDDLVRLLARVDALKDFLASEDGANLLIAYRRAANIVRIEEKKDGQTYDGKADASRFVQDEERALFDALSAVGAEVQPLLREERFAEAMSALARLRQPVDAFFDRVTVNTEDREVRANRLRLLAQIGSAMGEIANFSKIEG